MKTAEGYVTLCGFVGQIDRFYFFLTSTAAAAARVVSGAV